MNEQRNLVKNS